MTWWLSGNLSVFVFQLVLLFRSKGGKRPCVCMNTSNCILRHVAVAIFRMCYMYLHHSAASQRQWVLVEDGKEIYGFLMQWELLEQKLFRHRSDKASANLDGSGGEMQRQTGHKITQEIPLPNKVVFTKPNYSICNFLIKSRDVLLLAPLTFDSSIKLPPGKLTNNANSSQCSLIGK